MAPESDESKGPKSSSLPSGSTNVSAEQMMIFNELGDRPESIAVQNRRMALLDLDKWLLQVVVPHPFQHHAENDELVLHRWHDTTSASDQVCRATQF